MGSWRGAAGAEMDLGSRSRSARQRVKDRWWRPAVRKLVWTGGPKPE